VSRDVDLFHDTDEALTVSSEADCETLIDAGFSIENIRRLIGFVEVTLHGDTDEALEIQWVRDSAFRFFPLVTHEQLGLMLHPFDLATNKVLALVGRAAVRDWVDILTCHERMSPLGCLAWAACGKDPGLGPLFIVDEAARTARYPASEFDTLVFEGTPPDRAQLGRVWRAALADARSMIDVLPPADVGCAVLDADGVPFRGDARSLASALDAGIVRFHPGAIRGAFPTVRARS
jgi:hypothetical protein